MIDWQSPLLFFFDPVLRAPTIASMLMCFTAGLIGALVFLRKQSLVGEALSHAAYPGVMLGVIVAGLFSIPEHDSLILSIFILTGAFISSFLGLKVIQFLEQHCKVKSDAALCFVLSLFFGVGLTLASDIQFSYTGLYRQAQVYLYGQAATMVDSHIIIYGILALLILIVITLLYKEIQVITFDRSFATSLGMPVHFIEQLISFLVVLAIIIGIRSVGVVLMSAMLIAPPAAARQFTNRFSLLLALSAFFGLISGFLGNYLSVQISETLSIYYPGIRLALPTGPMIVILSTIICILSLMFAPKRGLVLRLYRIARFRYRCIGENILKSIWRISPFETVSFDQIAKYHNISDIYLKIILYRLMRQGWIISSGRQSYRLTQDGQYQAANIVRLHRLWEVYLVDYVGVGIERVHRNAEEMEHIITPELEKELTLLLKNPTKDPHQQPIPSIDRLWM